MVNGGLYRSAHAASDGDPQSSDGAILISVDAFGPGGARRTLEARIARADQGVVRLMSWKEVH